MSIFNCFKKKKNKHRPVEEIIINEIEKTELIKNDNLSQITKIDNNNFKNTNEIIKKAEEFGEEVDTSKDFEKVMARNAAVKMIQADLDKKSNKNKLLSNKKINKNPQNDKKKNFEELFKKEKN